jgi:hypothetical protein
LLRCIVVETAKHCTDETPAPMSEMISPSTVPPIMSPADSHFETPGTSE